MPADTKKRKINADGKAASSGSIIKDVKDLKKALKNCDTANLVEALSNSLDNAPPETIQVLKAVLMPLVKADSKPKHCVRCHNTYRESSNTIKSCVIKCTNPEETEIRDEQSDRPWEYHMWEFPCCGNLVSSEEVGDDCYGYDSEEEYDSDDAEDLGTNPPKLIEDFGVCDTMKHTTDPTSIKYYNSRRHEELEKTGINYSGRNKNIRTCEVMGCGKGKPKKKK